MSNEAKTKSKTEAEFASLTKFVSNTPYYRFAPAGSDKGLDIRRYLAREQAELYRKFGLGPDEAYQQYSTYIYDAEDSILEYKTAADVERERAARLNPFKKSPDNIEPSKAKKKISLADYKKKKEAGSKPSPEGAADILSRPSTASSATSASSAAPSFADLANHQPVLTYHKPMQDSSRPPKQDVPPKPDQTANRQSGKRHHQTQAQFGFQS